LFDCIIPTRHGRRGWAFTKNGRLNLRNARFLEDQAPLEEDCPCSACTSFSRAYLHHLIATRDMLGARLLSLHNIAFYMRLLAEMRTAIAQDRFEVWRREWRANYAGPTGDTTEDTGANPAFREAL